MPQNLKPPVSSREESQPRSFLPHLEESLEVFISAPSTLQRAPPSPLSAQVSSRLWRGLKHILGVDFEHFSFAGAGLHSGGTTEGVISCKTHPGYASIPHWGKGQSWERGSM